MAAARACLTVAGLGGGLASLGDFLAFGEDISGQKIRVTWRFGFDGGDV